MSTNRGPEARRRDLLARELDGELVVYDLARHRAHSLNPTASLLWRHCDGETPLAELRALVAESTGAADATEAVELGLRQLARARLLRDRHRYAASGLTRRQLLRRLGGAGALAAALPLVTTILVPTPAMAQTCLPKNAPCTASAQCCSGCCGSGSGKCKNGGGCLP